VKVSKEIRPVLTRIKAELIAKGIEAADRDLQSQVLREFPELAVFFRNR